VAKTQAEAHQSKETARITSERGIAESEAEAKRISESARIDAAIAVAQKSEAESQAKAKAEEARATAVRAEEQVATARAVEVAERAKKIAVIEARKEAEQAATGVTVKAEAEREAAQNLASAMLTQAEGEANANKVRAGGIIELGEAEAKRERALNEARNALSPQMVDFELTKQRIAIIPDALAQAMKPIEKISDIKIFSAGGLLGAMGNGASAEGLNGGPIADLSSQLLSYGAQKPILDAILSQAGFAGSNPVDALLNGTQRPTPPVPHTDALAKP
jgi:flotillin